MDRLNATSTAPPPDWPLPSLPPPSLINVSKESKRHCRLLPAGMVNLNLTQMADAANLEERKKHRNERKTLDCRQVEFTEHEFGKWTCACKRMPKKNKKNTEERKESAEEDDKKMKVARPNSFDQMIEAVDALLSTIDSPIEPAHPSTAAATEHSSPRTSSIIETVEQATCKTAIAPPSPPPTPPSLKRTPAEPSPASLAPPSPSPIPPTLPPIDSHTALHSHPPSPPERASAADLTATHQARLKTPRPRQPQNAPAASDAITSYGKLTSPITKSKLAFSSAVSQGFGEMMLMAAKVGRKKRRNASGAKKTKLTFSEAVHKGFREIFGEGEERCR